MKNIFLIILLSIIFGYANNSQLLAQVLKPKHELFKEEKNMYCDFNSNDKSIYVYNNDGTFWDKIGLEIPLDYTLDEIKLIETKSLNENIEFKFLYAIVPDDEKFNNNFQGRFNGQVYTVHILNSSGNSLLKLTNVVNYKILTSNKSQELFVIKKTKKKSGPKLYTETYKIN